MSERDIPSCSRKDCFACSKEFETCMILTDTRFPGDCPFFKTKETFRMDRERAERRLTRIRYDKEDANDDYSETAS